jgi:hypothetical protein
MAWLASIGAALLGNWQRILIYGLVVAGALATAAGMGYHQGVKKLWDYQVDQARAAVAIVVAQGKATERVRVRYVKVKAASVVVERAVETEVIRYVEKNPGLCLDAEWSRLHDESTGAVPGAAAGADGEGRAAPTAAVALATVTGNNARCIRTADKLDALQDWVREQSALNE